MVLHYLQLPLLTLSFTSGPAEPIIVLLNGSRSLAYVDFLLFLGNGVQWDTKGNTRRGEKMAAITLKVSEQDKLFYAGYAKFERREALKLIRTKTLEALEC